VTSPGASTPVWTLPTRSAIARRQIAAYDLASTPGYLDPSDRSIPMTAGTARRDPARHAARRPPAAHRRTRGQRRSGPRQRPAVDDQDTVGLTEVLGHVVAEVIADRVSVPLEVVERPLHPVRGAVAGGLCDGPTVLACQWRQQPEQVTPRSATRFHPSEAGRDARHHVVQPCYPVRHKIHRHKLGSLHSTIDAVAAPPSIPRPNQPLPAQTPNLKVRLEY
jgi:hypothetical protein